MDVRLPNGTIIKNVPEGTTKEVVMQRAIAAGLAKPEDFGIKEAARVPAAEDIPLFDNAGNPIEADMPRVKPEGKPSPANILGPAEALLSAGTGVASSLYGIGKGIVDSVTSGAILEGKGPQMAQEQMQRSAAAAAYQPRTEAGQDIMQFAGEKLGSLPPTLGGFSPAQSVGAMQAAGRTAQALGAERLAPTATRLTGQAQEAIKYAEENKLPLMTSDVIPVSSATGRGARVIGEQTPLLGTGGKRYAQKEAREGLLEKLKNETPEISDETISRSLIESSEKYKRVIGKRYEQIQKQMEGTPINLRKTIDTIDQELMELSKEGQVKDNATIEKLFSLREDLTSGTPDFATARNNRTYMRESLKTDSDKPSTQAQRVIDRVYDAMTEDIQQAVQQKLGNEARFKLAQADNIYATEIKMQKKSRIRDALVNGDQIPEKATKLLFAGEPSVVRDVYQTLDSQGRANARAAMINRVLEKAGESPEKFLSEVNRLKKQFGMMFRGQERAKLDGLTAYLDATRRAATGTLDTPTGMRTIPYIVAGGVGADLYGGGGAASITIGSIAALNRLYESTPVRKALTRMAKAKKGTPEFDNAYIAVDTAIRSQMASQQEEER